MYYLMTAHCTFVGTDDSGKLIQLNFSKENLPRLVRIADIETGCVIKDGALRGFELTPFPGGVSFTMGGKYLCALANSMTLIADRDVLAEWERFTAVAENAAQNITVCKLGSEPNAVLRNFSKYHLGCGGLFIRGFLNIDFYPNVAPDTLYSNHRGIEGANFLNYDLTKGVPGEDDTIELIYHCHFLEHLAYPEARRLLRQAYARLKPGGMMRILVPDLELWIQNYHDNNAAFFDAYRRQSLDNNCDVYKTKAAVFMGMLHGHGHRWGYDYETLHWLLQRVGFGEIRRLLYQESAFAQIIKEMEPYSPLRGMESLCVECTKLIGSRR